MKLSSGDETVEIRVEGQSAVLDGRPVAFYATRAGGRLETIRVGNAVLRVRAERDGNRVFVWCAGAVHEFRRAAGRAASAGSAAGGLLAPMPGRVRRVHLGEGARVGKGDVILILEAMKMEHAIVAPRDGVIAAVNCREGEMVQAGVDLVTMR
jgi:acetyl/propionyl-CoA carboxylase alpha subunit